MERKTVRIDNEGDNRPMITLHPATDADPVSVSSAYGIVTLNMSRDMLRELGTEIDRVECLRAAMELRDSQDATPQARLAGALIAELATGDTSDRQLAAVSVSLTAAGEAAADQVDADQDAGTPGAGADQVDQVVDRIVDRVD